MRAPSAIACTGLFCQPLAYLELVRSKFTKGKKDGKGRPTPENTMQTHLAAFENAHAVTEGIETVALLMFTQGLKYLKAEHEKTILQRTFRREGVVCARRCAKLEGPLAALRLISRYISSTSTKYNAPRT